MLCDILATQKAGKASILLLGLQNKIQESQYLQNWRNILTGDICDIYVNFKFSWTPCSIFTC